MTLYPLLLQRNGAGWKTIDLDRTKTFFLNRSVRFDSVSFARWNSRLYYKFGISLEQNSRPSIFVFMRCLFRSGRKEEIAEISIYSQMRCYHFINPLNALIPKKTSWKKKKKRRKVLWEYGHRRVSYKVLGPCSLHELHASPSLVPKPGRILLDETKEKWEYNFFSFCVF